MPWIVFKIQIGLPPELEVVLDESVLTPFELNNLEFDELEAINEALRLDILQFDTDNPPEVEQAKVWIKKLKRDFRRLVPLNEEVIGELNKWMDLAESELNQELSQQEREEIDRRKETAVRMQGLLQEIRLNLETDLKQLDGLEARIQELKPADLWDQIKDFAGKTFRERMADLMVIQTQIRVYLIHIRPVRISADDALAIAGQNRLDLMNARGRVIDAYRRVEVAADLLEGDLNVSLEADLATQPDRNNAFRFDSSAHRYRAGD